MKLPALGVIAGLLSAFQAAPVSAQSCPPPPAPVACTAAAPTIGATLSGPVLQVIDGGHLCIALGPTPSQWVAVEVADAPPEMGRGAMMAAAFAQKVDCVVTGEVGGAVRAVCRMGGLSVVQVAARVPPPAATWLQARAD